MKERFKWMLFRALFPFQRSFCRISPKPTSEDPEDNEVEDKTISRFSKFIDDGGNIMYKQNGFNFEKHKLMNANIKLREVKKK